jgi:hypothetical protein
MCTLCSFTVHAPSASAAAADACMGAFKSVVTELLSMGQTSAAEVRCLFCAVSIISFIASLRIFFFLV